MKGISPYKLKKFFKSEVFKKHCAEVEAGNKGPEALDELKALIIKYCSK